MLVIGGPHNTQSHTLVFLCVCVRAHMCIYVDVYTTIALAVTKGTYELGLT